MHLARLQLQQRNSGSQAFYKDGLSAPAVNQHLFPDLFDDFHNSPRRLTMRYAEVRTAGDVRARARTIRGYNDGLDVSKKGDQYA